MRIFRLSRRRRLSLALIFYRSFFFLPHSKNLISHYGSWVGGGWRVEDGRMAVVNVGVFVLPFLSFCHFMQRRSISVLSRFRLPSEWREKSIARSGAISAKPDHLSRFTLAIENAVRYNVKCHFKPESEGDHKIEGRKLNRLVFSRMSFHENLLCPGGDWKFSLGVKMQNSDFIALIAINIEWLQIVSALLHQVIYSKLSRRETMIPNARLSLYF